MNLATYATKESASLGRLYNEDYDSYLTTYDRDRDRLIHSSAFRRLEYKTQVFINHVGDHYRNRLTHSLEVAQTARAVALHLNLNESLAECIALAHDLGHPPFGHAGEDALREVTKSHVIFDHNAQALRIVTKLEQKYAEFDGLNLSWETLEGIIKHNGPLVACEEDLGMIHQIYVQLNSSQDFMLHRYASLEAQVASLADDIAYINHDIDDGLRANFFELEELEQFDLLKHIIVMLKARYNNIPQPRLINETTRRLMKYMVTNLIETTKKNIANFGIVTTQDVRSCKQTLVNFSPEFVQIKDDLKKFLFERVYRHYKINRTTMKANRLIKELFIQFMETPNCLPTEWYMRVKDQDESIRAQNVADYIAGMTDRFAIDEHSRLFDATVF